MVKASKKKKIRKLGFKILKSFIAGIIIMVLGTVGIDAVDNYNDMSESIIGRLIFGKPDGACPSDMVFVQASWGDFCIDKYEVSLSEDCQFHVPNNTTESKYNIDNPKCFALSESGKTPWTNLTQNQAVYACKKDGKRLPSNREWSFAAMGTPDHNSDWTYDDCHVAKNWEDQPGLTGTGSRCESFVGAYDMIGNVWEWVDGSVTDGQFNGNELPKEGYVNGINEENAMPSDTAKEKQELYNNDYYWIKDSKTRTIARGGYWDNKDQAGQFSHYIVSSPTDSGGATGFRCVQNAHLNSN